MARKIKLNGQYSKTLAEVFDTNSKEKRAELSALLTILRLLQYQQQPPKEC